MYVCMHVAYQELGDELWSLDSMAVAFPLVISGDIKTMQSRWFYSRQKGQFPSQHFFPFPQFIWFQILNTETSWNIQLKIGEVFPSKPLASNSILNSKKLRKHIQKN